MPYATTAMVAEFLNFNPPSGYVGGFTGDNNWRTFPSSGQVATRISRIATWIDQQTRNAWRTVTKTDEFHDFNYYRYRPVRWKSFFDEGSVHLRFFPIVALASGVDKLEVFTGQSTNDGYEDFLSTRVQGRNSDFWVDTNEGIIHFKNSRPFVYRDAVRVTYRHGESTIPADIERATILLTAAELVSTEDYSQTFPEGTQQLPFRDKVTQWKEEASDILDYRRRLVYESD